MQLRYTKLQTWFILLAVVTGVIFILMYSGGERGIYKSASPVTDSLLTATYPELYEAVANREIQDLKPFLSHGKQEIRDQAWRALASTPVDSLAPLINLAKQQNSTTAWFGISQHEIGSDQIRALEKAWLRNPAYRSGISRVLGKQGDAESLDFLMNQLDAANRGSEYQFGLAVGRLVLQYDLTENEQIGVLQNAFEADAYPATRAYLYGWYRGDESRLSAVAQDTLFSRWQVQGTGLSADVDQYVNKILPERTTSNMTIFYNGERRLDNEVQLSVELAKSIGKIEMNKQRSLAAKILLTNANPHVQIQTLRSLEGKISKGDDLYSYINGTMLADSTLANPVWLQAVQTAAQVNSNVVEEYEKRLKRIAEQHPYMLEKLLAVYEQTESPEAFLERLQGITEQENPLQTIHALQSMNRYWENLPESEQTESRITKIREMVFQALSRQDRGVAYAAQSLLRNEELFDPEDFDRINRSLLSFSLPEDIEVYQAFGSLYKDRFEARAKPTVDSLAALDYAPLNRSLAAAGWNVEVPDESQTEFRLPHWSRLWELGRNPVWTIRTEKGDIDIELSTLSAPATVSMIDSLSRAGAYDGVPFHRVIPNFVIQGGDISRGDGFGGPGFVIPTEASEQGFVRSAVGIASAGTDTEGSQYFIMHQWKPHLNGGYTRFGKVIEGMDIVDEITKGDKVLSATWY